MIQINLPMPKGCDEGYITMDERGLATRWPCPCYDAEFMSCQAFVPNRDLTEELWDSEASYKPEWCPLKEV